MPKETPQGGHTIENIAKIAKRIKEADLASRIGGLADGRAHFQRLFRECQEVNTRVLAELGISPEAAVNMPFETPLGEKGNQALEDFLKKHPSFREEKK